MIEEIKLYPAVELNLNKNVGLEWRKTLLLFFREKIAEKSGKPQREQRGRPIRQDHVPRGSPPSLMYFMYFYPFADFVVGSVTVGHWCNYQEGLQSQLAAPVVYYCCCITPYYINKLRWWSDKSLLCYDSIATLTSHHRQVTAALRFHCYTEKALCCAPTTSTSCASLC